MSGEPRRKRTTRGVSPRTAQEKGQSYAEPTPPTQIRKGRIMKEKNVTKSKNMSMMQEKDTEAKIPGCPGNCPGCEHRTHARIFPIPVLWRLRSICRHHPKVCANCKFWKQPHPHPWVDYWGIVAASEVPAIAAVKGWCSTLGRLRGAGRCCGDFRRGEPQNI